jgi:hypothetical protein
MGREPSRLGDGSRLRDESEHAAEARLARRGAAATTAAGHGRTSDPRTGRLITFAP